MFRAITEILNNPHSPMFPLYVQHSMKNNKKLWGNCFGTELEQLGYGYRLEYFDPFYKCTFSTEVPN